MATDPFAALRAQPIGVPTAYDEPLPEHAEHPKNEVCVLEKWQISATEHAEHKEHRKLGGRADWRAKADGIAADWNMPMEWAEGLAALQLMPTPAGATEWRWREIVADAVAFATRQHIHARETGWSIEDVFGCDLDDADSTIPLIFEIRGGATIILEDGTVIIRDRERRRYFYPGRSKPGTPPIWTINQRRRERIGGEPGR